MTVVARLVGGQDRRQQGSTAETETAARQTRVRVGKEEGSRRGSVEVAKMEELEVMQRGRWCGSYRRRRKAAPG